MAYVLLLSFLAWPKTKNAKKAKDRTRSKIQFFFVFFCFYASDTQEATGSGDHFYFSAFLGFLHSLVISLSLSLYLSLSASPSNPCFCFSFDQITHSLSRFLLPTSSIHSFLPSSFFRLHLHSFVRSFIVILIPSSSSQYLILLLRNSFIFDGRKLPDMSWKECHIS